MTLTKSGYIVFLTTISLITIFIYRWILGRSTVESKSEKKASPKEKTTFRVTGIPASWDRQQIRSFLQTQESMAPAGPFQYLPSLITGNNILLLTKIFMA
jgi:hypothetical protein